MTIFDTGYTDLDYQPTPPWRRIAALARLEFQQLFRTRLGVLLFVVCCLYLVVFLVVMQFTLNTIGSATAARVGEGLRQGVAWSNPYQREFYMTYALEIGYFPYLILSTLIGARAVSGDRAVNALEIYWTRGISPWGYFLGKWLGMSALLAAVFLLGPLLLWLLAFLSVADIEFLPQTLQFMPGVVAALGFKCLVLGLLPVCFSSFARSANATSFLWLLVHVGTWALSEVAELVHSNLERSGMVLGDKWYPVINPWFATVRIESFLAGIHVPGFQVLPAFLALGALLALFLPILARTLRSTEAVG